jgi:SpoVK/Ycf46/Vps4 family AAA+-type ATPase
MKNIVENEIIRELDNIYGIEESKWGILNYIKYLEISKENHFANYNVIIHNSSDYPSETKIKLINFLHDMLKKNNIIGTDYECVTTKQIRKFEKNDESNNKEEKKKKEDINLKTDLIIIDSEKIGRNMSNYREEIVTMMEEFKDKIYIIIDNSFCVGEVNAAFNKYFDWFFEIDKISENNKKDYVKNLLNENNIEVNEKCNYIDNLIEEPFFKVKTKMNNIMLQCKLNDITEITNEVAEKYLADKKDTLNNKNNKNDKNKKSNEQDLTFDSLVGINNIKEEIHKIVNYVKICKKRKSNMPMLHMCFTGNPGTGKTTVARIIGQIFKEEKILSNGNFVEVHGRDLIGKYVGWTAKEVQNYIRKAKGGILFIDEAYSLNSDRRGSFEDEAIATLIKEMEDNRDDLCVILAGYQEEMKDLIKRNPGFESRIQFYLDFPNYNEEELYEIFKNLVKKEGYKISSQIKELLQENFHENNSNETFSNGRYVRNLYEKVKIEQANRVALNEDEDVNLIKKCDIENVIEKTKTVEVPKIKIGFAS